MQIIHILLDFRPILNSVHDLLTRRLHSSVLWRRRLVVMCWWSSWRSSKRTSSLLIPRSRWWLRLRSVMGLLLSMVRTALHRRDSERIFYYLHIYTCLLYIYVHAIHVSLVTSALRHCPVCIIAPPMFSVALLCNSILLFFAKNKKEIYKYEKFN